MNFSIIIPVYNRPDEVRELLQSLTKQTDADFETVIVEDGSTVKCDEVCETFEGNLRLKYLSKPNTGRSDTRNFGMRNAAGDYFLIFDSDCILPPQYVATVRKNLMENFVDCFGGPDAADDSFSPVQKAINYSMTSFFTTGGIRGGTKNAEKFSPRSFNMGLSKRVFERTGGYKNMIGEDIDLSIRVKQLGFTTTLFRDACVFHKRRISLKKFFRQVNTFGKGRIVLNKLHKGSLKIVHLMPMAFALACVLLTLLAVCFCNLWFLSPAALFILLIFSDSLVKNKNLKIAFLSIIAAFTQLFGYGTGMLNEIITHKAEQKTQEELYK